MTTRGGKKKTTIYDVAAATDASVSTVSLVLNGDWSRYRIKEETSERILKSARDLGYEVNLRARGLRLSRSGLAGMILPHYRNRFFADLAETLKLAFESGTFARSWSARSATPKLNSKVVRTLLAQRVEFLFIAGVADPSVLNRMCDEASIPCVNVDLPGSGAPSVVSDNRAGAFLVTQKLIEKVRATGGSTDDMLFLGGVAGEYATDNRVAGFREVLRAAGAEPRGGHGCCCGYRRKIQAAFLGLMSSGAALFPSGVFLSSITTFEGVVRYSVSTGSALDCAVGCFDWDPFAADLPFTVAMLRQDVETMLELAFTSLLDDESQSARGILMVPPILERA